METSARSDLDGLPRREELLILVLNLVDRVGGVFERFVEFLKLLGGVGLGVVLEFFHNYRGIVQVG